MPVSCSSGDSGEGEAARDPSLVAVRGVVLDPRGEPLADVPVEAVAGLDDDRTGPDGSFSVDVPRSDPRLRFGGLFDTAFVVRIDVDGSGAGAAVVPAPSAAGVTAPSRTATATDVARPFFLAFGEDGFVAAVPSGTQPGGVVIESPFLRGLILTLEAGTSVVYPAGASAEVFLAPVAGDRLPLGFPGGRSARFAVHVGPLDVRFDPPASITLPSVEGLPPGTALDLVHLDPSTGSWIELGEVTVGESGETVAGGPVARGGLYAALPRAEPPQTTARGRIIGVGREALGGYIVLGPGSRTAVSGSDGFFELEEVPVRPGAGFRLQVLSPREFRHEFFFTELREPVLEDAGGGGAAMRAVTDFGEVLVSSALRVRVPPAVSYDPPNGATGVNEVTRVRVAFDRLMDVGSLDVELVRGISRRQRDVEGTLFLRFPGASTTEVEFLALEPLRNEIFGEEVFYTVFIPKESRDVDGNLIDPDDSLSRFTVRRDGAEVDPDDFRVHSIVPNEGIAGDEIEVLGENLTNAQGVLFGDVPAFVAPGDVRDGAIRVTVPEGIAGEVPVRVRDMDGGFRGHFPFRPLPVVDLIADARPARAGDGSLGVEIVGAHLGASPVISWNGLGGGSIVELGGADCPIAFPSELRRKCFAIDLPAGVASGELVLEVDGVLTQPFFVVESLPVDDAPPVVVESSVLDGGTIAADEAVVLLFSEVLDRRSAVEVLADGAPLAGATQEVAAGSEIVVLPPAGGWPTGSALAVVAGDAVLDLAGNLLDQDPATAPREDFTVSFTATAP